MFRVPEFYMAEIGRKPGQHLIQIGAGLIPGDQAVNRECVPQIVQPWLISIMVFSSNVGDTTKPAEYLVR